MCRRLSPPIVVSQPRHVRRRPLLGNISPSSHSAGRFAVDLIGSNFQQGAKVVVSGNGRSSEVSQVMYDNAGHLQAVMDLNAAANFSLMVRNPDGQFSGAVLLQVTATNASPPETNPA